MTAALVLPFDPAAVPAELEAIAPAGVLARWRSGDRSRLTPELVAVAGPDGWTAAALVSARPTGSYLKIVDAVGDAEAAVAAVVDLARERGLAQVVWEGWDVDASQAAASGFTPLAAPLSLPDPEAQPPAGFVRWLAAGQVVETPYYRQSTPFTCGAVTAHLAQAPAAAEPQTLDRPAELTFWREATNFPACEPVGLGVAVHRAWPGSHVTIALDVDRPVLVEHLEGDERAWREVLQEASRETAAAAGVPIDAERFSIADLRAALAAGERVLLLISIAALHGVDVPHWVLCHGAVDGAIVIEDPWTHAAGGDTWLDAHLLPIPDDALDAMAQLESDRFRGAVRIAAPVGAVRVAA